MAIERSYGLFDLATWPFHDEDDMPETNYHVDLADYLSHVIGYQFATEKWLIVRNLAIYPPDFPRPLTPDVALFVGVPDGGQYISSWKLKNVPTPPTVVFELASDDTVANDVYRKPPYYAALGVAEYYAYDPRPKKRPFQRLRGWQPGLGGTLIELQPDPQGRMWSRTLESWLTPDGPLLRLYDSDGTIRPTPAEAERQHREVTELQLMQAEARLVLTETRLSAEQQARAQAEAQLTTKLQQAEERMAAMRERLRALGINPDAG